MTYTESEIRAKACDYADHKMSYGIYPDSAWQRFYDVRKMELENELD